MDDEPDDGWSVTDDGQTDTGRTNTIYLEALHNRPLRGKKSKPNPKQKPDFPSKSEPL